MSSLSSYLSVYLSIYLSLPVYLQAWKPSYSARLLHFSKLTTSKTQQFCVFLIFQSWNIDRHQNNITKQFCETSSFLQKLKHHVKNEAILRDFFNFWTWQHQKQSNSARLPSKMESWVQSWQPRTNAFCDFSSPPVESTAPATKKWCQVIRSAAPVTQNHLSKPEDLMLQNATPLRKSAPWPPNSSDEHVSCTAPATRKCIFADPLQMSHACHRFWKCYKTLTFCSLLTRCTIPCACHAKRTSERPKVVRAFSTYMTVCLYILTSKCASRHNACTFSTSQLPKVVRTWCVLYILASKCASRHNGVQFFISHLARWLRTRRFSEPTFRPSGATNHWKNTVFATFLPFRASASSFFWLFLFSDLLSSTLLFSLTLPISAFHLSILSEVWQSMHRGLPNISILLRTAKLAQRFRSTLHTHHSTFHSPQPTLHTLQTLHFSSFPLSTFSLFCFSASTFHWSLHAPGSTLRTSHSTLRTPHSTLHASHSALDTPHFTLHTLHSTLQTSHSPLLTPHFTLSNPHFTLSTPHSMLHTAHSTLHSLPRFTLHTLHSTLRTLHSTLHTSHSPLHAPQSTLHTSHSMVPQHFTSKRHEVPCLPHDIMSHLWKNTFCSNSFRRGERVH